MILGCGFLLLLISDGDEVIFFIECIDVCECGLCYGIVSFLLVMSYWNVKLMVYSMRYIV